MKNVLISITSIIILGIICVISVSCSDDNNNEHISDTNYKKTAIYNSKNPYDVYGSGVEQFYIKMKDLLNNKGLAEDYEVYQKDVDTIIKSIDNKYPVIEEKTILSLDTTYTKQLMKTFFSNIEQYGLYYAVELSENAIQNIKDENARNVYFCLISELKYDIYYSDKILYSAPNWETRLDNCIRNEMHQLFSHGSIVEQVQYIAGLPYTFYWTVANCSYAATFTPNAKICQS